MIIRLKVYIKCEKKVKNIIFLKLYNLIIVEWELNIF